MGLFASRPEEPEDWAGIPSEPAAPESAAEKLANAASAIDSVYLLDGSVESILIPVPPVTEVAQVSIENGQGGPDDDAQPDD